ncbi:putative photosynthetic complex assembly protein PuhE [Loktanella sp. SALINAS62]|uniref:putative photosynthetic complex assembly protein PuhE n=1 Tax=Loktanella sp. SALINAS62 TaxID=2706124 RepID=UPI001B8B1293|nr:putative photosynthetic complex assembly protein PuhE [Loktanella sp. SALINAS62]MBS1302284.1 DUF3623 domain-containing protein [Loktanella sp. SALINAS62]
MTGSLWASVGFAVFLWWFLTGAIMLAVRLADRLGQQAPLGLTVLSLPLLFGGCLLVGLSLSDPTVPGVYLGFLGALAIWGWMELAFLTGVIAGWQRADCPPDLTGWDRFQRAFATVGYHELLLAVGALVLTLASAGTENRMALAVFLILFLARITAKLNLFLGVPRINTEFLPARLTHLKTYFRRGAVTWMFPLAITILTALLAVCAERLWGAQTLAPKTGYALLTALAALALIEHWLMVIPLPDAKLWAWMLPAKTKTKGDEHGL